MKELLTRSLSGLVYVGLIVAALTASQNWLWGTLLFSVFLFVTAWELAGLLGIDRKFFLAYLGIYWLASTALLVYLVFAGTYGLMLYSSVLKFTAVFWLAYIGLTLWLVFRRDLKTLWGMIYLALPYTVTLLLLMWEPRLVLFLFIILWLNDTFAYLSGRFAGRHKLAPSVSPKKTWEGLIGGILAVLLVVYMAVKTGWIHRVFDFIPSRPDITFWILLVLTALAGVAGDLLESALKRRAGVKDAGNIIPGHGGLLDRLDSYLVAVVIFFLYITWMYRQF
ncbi:MAG: phosphatidate cytidylyltransferase [Chlorobi bacterium]|nr:phosphatidate cytidylyltransferase [Chlorobiota bacterium]